MSRRHIFVAVMVPLILLFRRFQFQHCRPSRCPPITPCVQQDMRYKSNSEKAALYHAHAVARSAGAVPLYRYVRSCTRSARYTCHRLAKSAGGKRDAQTHAAPERYVQR